MGSSQARIVRCLGGALDVLVNNAAIALYGTIEEFSSRILTRS
jgi:NAD(P)-dependent dehydrogenase (short-subunit alcohol dehydrogenase family)